MLYHHKAILAVSYAFPGTECVRADGPGQQDGGCADDTVTRIGEFEWIGNLRGVQATRCDDLQIRV